MHNFFLNQNTVLPNCIRYASAVLCLFFFLLVTRANAQTVLTISGEVTKPLTLQVADLKAMPHTSVTGKDRDGKEHQYSGIPLVDLLKLAGATLGGELRGENLVKYAVVKAIDGYEVLFALPEIDPEYATRTILLADSVDGSPLPQGVGPYRVVVPGEKKPARWIREVKSIEIRFAK
ncbi:molybdopterin-dependent oxidoreductase [Spirosoma endbachense]|uniref:Molybdopterin-dependent oxidoreductase n=1 Tax=Spirosoma endbachense TaxID=2666025 RepID=A0A6P1VU92_9BACT|nr:molybdopterin-dependent oxidoreductase [Spirosoma endbachense]QHV96781.1 molybdopterin-dependent oxidoreductase [Spirosoma endbachense]